MDIFIKGLLMVLFSNLQVRLRVIKVIKEEE